MSAVLLDHHSRLGDHLTMNGAVREYAARYERVGIFCIPEYRETVTFMFRDLGNVCLENAPTHRSKQFFELRNLFTRRYERIVRTYDDLETGILPELQFYKMAGVEHQKKWDKFHVERDQERESSLYARIAPPGPYVFLHDDSRYQIDQSRVQTVLPIVRPQKGHTSNIFDYCTVIERATEIHVIDSSLMFLVDLLPYVNPEQRLYVHRYARPNPAFNVPILRKQFEILE